MADTSSPNAEQIKKDVEGVFSRAALTYDQNGPRYFAHFGQRLVEYAQIRPGAQVLDIACGRGAVLFPAAQAVGSTGQVTAIDLAPVMVLETGREVQSRGVANAHLLQMDAEHLEFSADTFDWVLCGFSIFFFPQLDLALSEIRRVLKPGGQFVTSTWGKPDERWLWMRPLIKRYLPPDPAEDQPQPNQGPVFHTPEGLEAILAGARFEGVRVKPVNYDFAYANEDEWWAKCWSHGSRHDLEIIEQTRGQEGLEEFKSEAFEHLRMMRAAEGIPQQLRALLAVGKKLPR